MSPKDLSALSKAIKGLDPSAFALGRFGLVGAEAGEYEGLSLTDNSILRSIVGTIEKIWDLPEFLSPEKEKIIINIDHEEGGKDFQTMQFSEGNQFDVIALCNIPEDVEGVDNFVMRHLAELEPEARDRLLRSFQSSVHHNDTKKWKQQIVNSGAKVVFLFGTDTFRAEDIISDDFIEVPYGLKGGHRGSVFIRKDYLAACHDYLFVCEKPLLELADGVVDEMLAKRDANPHGLK